MSSRLFIALALSLAACARPVEKQTLTIWWAQWAPADGLQELGHKFQAETGIEVRVHQIPWPSYQDQVNLEFGNDRTAFDIVVGDSQWLGRGAAKRLYVDLTDWLKTAVDMSRVHPRARQYLCEYGGRLYAAPCESDAMGVAYRKDWFENADEKEAYKKQFNRELRVPETWEEFRDIAKFFHRPAEKRYGCAILTGRGYDALTMGFEQILYAFGGSWGDSKTFQVRGAVNSEGAVAGLDFLKDLLRYSPDGGSKLDYGEVLEPLTNGSTAMSVNYFAFFPKVVADMGGKVGFFAMPRQGDRRFASLGGQGFSISTKTDAAGQERARRFIAWFLKEPVQREWIRKPAGFTADKPILDGEEFRSATPYNRAFAESLDLLVDFWNVPVYGDLLAVVQQYVGEALDGKKSSKEALDAIAEEHEKIFERARADGLLPAGS
jgi:multiple sugar transport system substrate-binding protein